MKNKFTYYIQNLQDQIVAISEVRSSLSNLREDLKRPEGGGGRTRVKRKCYRKGGVNISAVHGKLPMKMFNVGEADFLPAD
jgi:coproporphyrinogen III oxidase